ARCRAQSIQKRHSMVPWCLLHQVVPSLLAAVPFATTCCCAIFTCSAGGQVALVRSLLSVTVIEAHPQREVLRLGSGRYDVSMLQLQPAHDDAVDEQTLQRRGRWAGEFLICASRRPNRSRASSSFSPVIAVSSARSALRSTQA